MPPLFIIFVLATVAVLSVFLISIIVGVGLCISKRFRTIGILVLLVPTLAALAAGTASWGSAFLFDSLSKSAASPQALQSWQVLTFWAWPVGLVVGGLAAAGIGVLLSVLIVKRRARPLAPGSV